MIVGSGVPGANASHSDLLRSRDPAVSAARRDFSECCGTSALRPSCVTPVGGLAGPRLKLVLDYIQDTLAQHITLRELAELAGVSPRHFERAFRQATGMAPHAYVMEKRVAAAQHLLITDPELSVQEIALQASWLGLRAQRIC
jgi:transcriptional regulator GlxA family with amidase domain